MIRREHGELVAECDGCGAEFAGGCQDDFRRFVADLKEAGWRCVKDEDEARWEHYCEGCR